MSKVPPRHTLSIFDAPPPEESFSPSVKETDNETFLQLNLLDPWGRNYYLYMREFFIAYGTWQETKAPILEQISRNMSLLRSLLKQSGCIEPGDESLVPTVDMTKLPVVYETATGVIKENPLFIQAITLNRAIDTGLKSLRMHAYPTASPEVSPSPSTSSLPARDRNEAI